jgi:hypothetical protein
MRVLTRLLVACLSLSSLPALAETFGSLYQVREPVASQQPEVRDAALQKALDTLIVRLTGDPAAPQNAALAELRKDPQQVIGQYGYAPGNEQALVVEFDPASTQRALQQADLPLWGANRPSILAWWLSDEDDGSHLIGDGQPNAAGLRRAALYRGLPLRLPLADLQEQLLATPETLQAGQVQELQAASQRYSADAVLAVYARQEGEQWQAQWQLSFGDNAEQGNATGADPAALEDAVMLAVSQRLAPHFVVAPGAAQRLTLIVEGADLGRYAQLQQIVDGLNGRLRSVEGTRLVYEVNTSAEQLRTQLALLQLQEAPAQTAEPDAEGVTPAQSQDASVLRFHWQ